MRMYSITVCCAAPGGVFDRAKLFDVRCLRDHAVDSLFDKVFVPSFVCVDVHPRIISDAASFLQALQPRGEGAE